MEIKVADVAELVDARDLKSLDGNVVWVRVPPPAPKFCKQTGLQVSPHVTFDAFAYGATEQHGNRISDVPSSAGDA